MGVLKKLFIITLLLFPLGELIRINLGNSIVLKPLDIGTGLVVIVWLIFKLIKKEKIKQKYVIVPILLFATIGFFSLIINYFSLSLNQFLASLMYLVRWIEYVGIFFVVSEFDKSFKKKIINSILSVGLIVVIVGYIQYFFYPSLKSLFYLGWDEHMHRMFSVFFDPNFAGAFFVLLFLFLSNLFFNKKNKLIGLLSILTLGAIFLTFSRSALIMLITSSAVMFTLMNKKIWIVLLFIITFLVLVISSKYFNIENINLFRVVSTEARLETAKNAITIIKDHPIFGVGLNSYRYIQIRYGFRNKNAELSHADAGVDNSILFVLATTGGVGLILYLLIWFRILKIQFSPLAVASVFGIFIDSMFINSLFYPSLMFWLWVVLGL